MQQDNKRLAASLQRAGLLQECGMKAANFCSGACAHTPRPAHQLQLLLALRLYEDRKHRPRVIGAPSPALKSPACLHTAFVLTE